MLSMAVIPLSKLSSFQPYVFFAFCAAAFVYNLWNIGNVGSAVTKAVMLALVALSSVPPVGLALWLIFIGSRRSVSRACGIQALAGLCGFIASSYLKTH